MKHIKASKIVPSFRLTEKAAAKSEPLAESITKKPQNMNIYMTALIKGESLPEVTPTNSPKSEIPSLNDLFNIM